MIWLFAILIVLVMGGVAMVAAGRGEPMSTAYDDRPDALVPAQRPIAAEDLRRVRFSLAFRGYRMSEVDALLERLAAQLSPTEPGAEPGSEPVPKPGPEPLPRRVSAPPSEAPPRELADSGDDGAL